MITRLKNIIFLALILPALFFVSTNANAQIKVGIKIGTNLSKASINNRIFSSENRAGFLVGPMMDVKLPILGLGIDIAVQYNCRYLQLDAADGSGLNSGVPNIHTIDIPMNAKWTIGNDKILSFYGATGPQISWNIGGQNLKSILNANQYTMRSSMFSWNFGLGATIVKKFRLGYTYNIGIGETADINIIDELGEAVHGNLRNHSHQFFLVHFF